MYNKLEKAQTTSSLSLQILLHFDLYFSALFITLTVPNMVYKINSLEFEPIQTLLVPAFFTVWALSNCVRLWFAFKGNLLERVPEMSAFLLLSMFPCIPFAMWSFNFQENSLPLDRALAILLMLLMLTEIRAGYKALKVLIHKKTSVFFRLCQDENELNQFEPETL